MGIRPVTEPHRTRIFHCSRSSPAPAAPPVLSSRREPRSIVGRIVAPVLVNGQGPFKFMVDTGANAR
jgi:hypothetical protein